MSSARESLQTKPFLDEDFLLDTPAAIRLYQDCASRLPIEEVARRLGSATPSNFARAFQRWTGKTPLQYRRDAGGA